MKLYLFIYNVVAIKANLSELPFNPNDHFVLIGSDYVIEKLSEENKAFFDEIYPVQRNFHQVESTLVDNIICGYLQSYQPENIVLLTNEDSTQLVCAAMREKHSIPGTKTSQVLPYVNKDISKKKLSGVVRAPYFVLFDKVNYQKNPESYVSEIIETIGFPMFIKPIDLVSSIGTYAIGDSSTLSTVLAIIDKEPFSFEIDEYIEGELFHCDLIVHNQDVKFFMAGHYANPLAKFSKGSPMGSIGVVDEILLMKLKEFSLKTISKLGVFSSAFHIEIFVEKGTGELVFLEAAARTPGALVPEMYKIMFNIHLEKLHYISQISASWDINVQERSCYAGWMTYPKIEGYVTKVNAPQINIPHQLTSFVAEGDKLTQAQSLLDSACSVVYWDKSAADLEAAFYNLKAHHPLVMREIG